MNQKKVVVIGAAGQMMSIAARALATQMPSVDLVLADHNKDALGRLGSVSELAQARKVEVDIGQTSALFSLIAGADLVMHGAGPYFRTASSVRRACLDAGVDYLDLDDDVESNVQAIEMDASARARGVRLFVGCGASPGLTNLLAADAMAQLDEVAELEVAWCIGDEGRQNLGRAVAEHALHIGAGDCTIIDHRQRVVLESMGSSTVFPMGGALGDHRLYLTAHPETVQFAFSHSSLNRIVCWGGFNPIPFNGVIRGVAVAVRSGLMSEDNACRFLSDIAADRTGSLNAWRYAASGLWVQWRANEIGARELCSVIGNSLLKRHGPCRSGIAARAMGTKNGSAHFALSQMVPLDGAIGMPTMAEATGISAALFAMEALEAPPDCTGTLFPHMWVGPGTVLRHLRNFALGSRLIGAVVQRECYECPGSPS